MHEFDCIQHTSLLASCFHWWAVGISIVFRSLSGRKMRHTRFCIFSSGFLATISFLAIPTARAAYIINITQVGSNVVATVPRLDRPDQPDHLGNHQHGPQLYRPQPGGRSSRPHLASKRHRLQIRRRPELFRSGCFRKSQQRLGCVSRRLWQHCRYRATRLRVRHGPRHLHRDLEQPNLLQPWAHSRHIR